MSTKRLSACLLFVLTVASYAPAPVRALQAPPEVSCAACIVIDDSGDLHFARNARTSRPNASTTKMVTALVVRRRAGLSEDVRISTEAAATGGGGLALEPGGGYEVEELLLALLMTSSNDAAVALAEHVAGSEAAFVELMNRTADRKGWTGTQFVTSHGLDQPGHFSTARDLASIAEEILDDPALARIVGLAEAKVTGPEGPVVLENRNVLLESYRGATGVKTGFTDQAGNVLVASARRSGRTVIAVAMGSADAADDAAALLDFAFARMRRTVLVSDRVRLGSLVFDGAGSTGLIPRRAVRGPVRPEDVTVVFVPRPGLSLPLETGEAVGVFEVSDGRSRVVATVDALAEGDVEAPKTSLVQRAFSGLLRGVASVMGAG